MLLTDGGILRAGNCYGGKSLRPIRTYTILLRVFVAGEYTQNQYVTTANAELYHPAAVLPSPAMFSLAGNGQGQIEFTRAPRGALEAPREQGWP